jgi:hypothetical protein
MLVIGAIIVVPFWRLLPRFGIPNWVALAALIPFGAIVLLYVMAFREELGGKGGAS